MTTIWVTTKFAALHYWPEAPVEVSFLQHPHRHEFHVKLEVQVSHGNRELEFFIIKKWLDNMLTVFSTGAFTYSCEQFAMQILRDFESRFPPFTNVVRRVAVTVSEDGENGATVER